MNFKKMPLKCWWQNAYNNANALGQLKASLKKRATLLTAGYLRR